MLALERKGDFQEGAIEHRAIVAGKFDKARLDGDATEFNQAAGNRGVIARCEKIAAEKTKSVPCMIQIGKTDSQ